MADPRTRPPAANQNPTGPRPAALTALLVSALLLVSVGCRSTLADIVERATEDVLTHLPAGREQPASHRVAVVAVSEGGRQSVSERATFAIWEYVDRQLVNHPGTTGISPALVRQTMEALSIRGRDLYALEPRQRFLSALANEGQTPDLILFVTLSPLQKTGPGYRPPTFLMSLELLAAASGERLAKESETITITAYE